MENKIHLKVITHEKVVYENDIDELYIQATDGKMGILKNHVPIIASLEIGVAKAITNKDPQCIAIMGGILNFANNEAVILTDVAELDCNIDVARATQARERALTRINSKEENIDVARAQLALAKSIARINATNKTF